MFDWVLNTPHQSNIKQPSESTTAFDNAAVSADV